MKKFAERLCEALEIRNISSAELSRRTGINEATLSNYRKGKYEPKQRRTENIAEALFVDIAWLMGADVPIEPRNIISVIKGKPVPVLGYVRAGYPSEAYENILGYEVIDENLARKGDYFALTIKGDSMLPQMHEGDTVIVRKTEQVENGQLAVVSVGTENATVKKYYQTENGIKLISFNPAYEPFYYSPEEAEKLQVCILGKVVECRIKYE